MMSGPWQGTLGALGAVAALVLLTACAAAEERPRRFEETALSAEDLSAKVGCRPEMRTKAQELRQGVCKTADGNYVVTSFTTEQGRRDWLEYAQMYGGTHLVGRRWVVTAPAGVLEVLRETLGGRLQGNGNTPGP